MYAFIKGDAGTILLLRWYYVCTSFSFFHMSDIFPNNQAP